MSTQRYRRKALIIEAMQWNGNNFMEMSYWCPFVIQQGANVILKFPPPSTSPDVVLELNDWVLKAGDTFAPGRLPDFGYLPFETLWESIPIASEGPEVAHH